MWRNLWVLMIDRGSGWVVGKASRGGDLMGRNVVEGTRHTDRTASTAANAARIAGRSGGFDIIAGKGRAFEHIWKGNIGIGVQIRPRVG